MKKGRLEKRSKRVATTVQSAWKRHKKWRELPWKDFQAQIAYNSWLGAASAATEHSGYAAEAIDSKAQAT